MLPEEQKAPFKKERARLSSFIQRSVFKDQRSRGGVARNTSRRSAELEEADLHGYLKGEGDNQEGETMQYDGEVGQQTSKWKKSWAGPIPERKSWGSNADA
jgi:hypothetical protein